MWVFKNLSYEAQPEAADTAQVGTGPVSPRWASIRGSDTPRSSKRYENKRQSGGIC